MLLGGVMNKKGENSNDNDVAGESGYFFDG